MKGTECITWLEKKYGNLSNIIDYNKFVRREVEIVYYNDYWTIEYNDEVLLDEEVLDLLLEEERLNNRG